MSYEYRDAINAFSTSLSQDRAASDTTLVAPAFANLPSDYSNSTPGKYLPLALNNFATGANEIVWVIGHTASSTSVTVLRGKEGTTALPWEAGTSVTCAPTAKRDGVPVLTSGTMPSDPHLGMRGIQTDRKMAVERTDGGFWVPSAGVGFAHEQGANMNGVSPPAGAVFTMRAGSAVGTTSASGALPCTFAQPFPNECMGIAAMSTFLNANGILVAGALSKTGATIYFMRGDGTRYASLTASYQYFAFGW